MIGPQHVVPWDDRATFAPSNRRVRGGGPGRRARPGFIPDQPLTPRMLDYLRAAAEGLSQAETAARLWVTVETAKGMRKQIIRRLEARNMTHAVHLAWQSGLLA